MTDRYAVVGNPVAHSKSPLIHAEFARQTGAGHRVRAACSRRSDGFRASVGGVPRRGGQRAQRDPAFQARGVRACARRSQRALRSGAAVNTLKFDGDGMFGDNTDGVGPGARSRGEPRLRDRRRARAVDGRGRRRARGAWVRCSAARPAALLIANRTVDKARGWWSASRRGPANRGVAAQAATASCRRAQFDLVINATSASLSDARSGAAGRGLRGRLRSPTT